MYFIMFLRDLSPKKETLHVVLAEIWKHVLSHQARRRVERLVRRSHDYDREQHDPR